jgi:hypothetical protein
MIVILGHKGNMGARYGRILDHLGVDWIGLDQSTAPIEPETIRDAVDNSNGVIIATPTETHVPLLKLVADLETPVFCEKPITKNLKELREILVKYQDSYTPFSMVLQYKELLNDVSFGNSSYNYFKTGKDGLEWDCIQIIGLAKGHVEIKNDSPIWECTLNGQKLNLSDMDQAYIWNVQRWLNGQYQSLKEVYEIHERVEKFINNKSSDRHSGQNNLR